MLLSKSVRAPPLILRSLTLPLNLIDSQSVHLSGSGGNRNLNGPLLLEVAIGRVTILDAFVMLFSISIGENKSNAEEATSSLLSDSPPIPSPESILSHLPNAALSWCLSWVLNNIPDQKNVFTNFLLLSLLPFFLLKSLVFFGLFGRRLFTLRRGIMISC